jgi:hypothetical protein
LLCRTEKKQSQDDEGPKESKSQTSTDEGVHAPQLGAGIDVTDLTSLEGTGFMYMNPKMLRGLAMLTWFVTFLYGFRQLPYTIMIPVMIFMIAAGIAYLKGRTQETEK